MFHGLVQFVVSLLLCLLDWCLALPMKMLLEPVPAGAVEEQQASRAPLLDYIYRVSMGKEGDLLCLAGERCLSHTLEAQKLLCQALGNRVIQVRSYKCKMLRR